MQTSDSAVPPLIRGLRRVQDYLAARISHGAVLAGRHPLTVGALGTLVALSACGLTLFTLADGRRDAIEHAHDTSRSVVSILNSDVQHHFELADMSLQAVAAGLRDPLVMKLDPDIRHKVLFDRTITAEYVSAVSALDESGNVIEFEGATPPNANMADRDYFYLQAQNPRLGLYVSKPYHSRLRNGARSIALSRRIDNADGSFGGVAVIAVSLDYFQQLLDRLRAGPNGITAVIRTDGTIVARSPEIKGETHFFTIRSPSFRQMVEHPGGSYAAVSPVDGMTRDYTFERIPGTSLIAVVAPAEQDVLAGWRRRSEVVGASALFVSTTFIVVVWLLAFALRDRSAMQSQLEHLAQTDSLTGLDNRRALDKTLLTEWHRMKRTGRELSVLFIDADHFKKYNDQHGHAVGDYALMRIAAALELHLQRPGDSIARYGGEEFVAVLPDTGERGALNIAEAIRREVEVCHSPAGGRRIPAVTVSIGCGTAGEKSDASLEAFMRRADAALYMAKAAGRNHVVAAAAAASAATAKS
jgi:diguanylate cyclase (GGDEF)-like protein